MRLTPPDTQQSHGFSLIEMAIVLVIVLTVLTLGLGALSSVVTSTAYSETKARQARIKDALTAYFGANKRLPCPNIPSVTVGVTGIEDRVAGACAATFGVVPYATLGLSRDVGEDGWGGLFSYQPYTGVAPVCPGTGNDWTNSACFGAGKTGGFQIAEGPISPPTIIASGGVAVLISHGPNGLRAWVRQGTRNANPLTCDEAHNSLFPTFCTLTNNRFFKGERAGNDDVVAYLTADDIIQALAKQGTILSATAQVNEDLRINMQAAIGQVLVAGSLYSSVPTLTINRDPWGSPYQINSNISSIANTGVVSPIGASSAICIFSYGPNLIDGIGSTPTSTASCTASGDDIVASVSSPALTAMFTNKACSPSC